MFERMERIENFFVSSDLENDNLDSKESSSERTMSQNLSETLEELNKQFEISIREFQITQNPDFRKKSADIAKQIK